jgi:MscS family membrane protein
VSALLDAYPRAAAYLARTTGSVLFVAAVVLVAVALARAYRMLLDRYAVRRSVLGGAELAREFNPLFAKVGSLFIALIALITVLQHFGVNVASLVVSLGVGSLAVGLAAQDTLSNMFAGFTLMIDRPFRVGDRIQLASGETGDVDAIGMRSTLIKTPEDTILVVPNSLLVKERLVNLSRPTRHLTTRVEVGVAYGSDLARVKEVLKKATLASPHVDPDREPVVQIARFGDFAVHFVVVFWARDYLHQAPARSDVAEAVYSSLAAAGIEIPQLPRAGAAGPAGAAKAV